MRPLADPVRLLDLVRYQRAELHEQGLISDTKYAELLRIKGSPARLEKYAEAIENESKNEAAPRAAKEGEKR
ncbi:MAG: hypothetical protein ABIT01_05875 [Thermoanaerobaculia bacterium]